MALTKVSTDGVKDDAITKTKIPANQIEASELADNAVDTNAIANNAVTAGKLASGVQTTINNNADNRLITGSGTANTLNGESQLTYDGTTLGLKSNDARITIEDNTSGTVNSAIRIIAFNGTNFIQSGTNLDNDSASTLAFSTINGATTWAKFDSSGNFGINATPNTNFKLDVNGAARIGNTTDGIIIENSTSNAAVNNACRIHRHGATGNLHITAGTSTARNMIFGTKTNGGEIARFTDTGLCFNGDTAAANALDDYEEGNWTPTGSGFTVSSVVSARYTKVGRLVTINAYVNAATGNGTAAVVITNLPFSQYGNSNYHYGNGRIGSAGGNTNSQNNITFQIQQNSNSAKIYVNDGGINEQMISGQHIIFSATYEAA